MSNANRNMLGTAVHAFDHFGCHMPWAACGKPVRHTATARPAVTCKRCLASLAKRDRAFQRKARSWYGARPRRWNGWDPYAARQAAARAVAAEEGRS